MMTVKGFIFLLAVTMVAIAIGALVGDRFAAPGFERTVVVAIVAAPIVFLAGRFAERRGWVSGYFSFDRNQAAAPPRASDETAPGARDANDRPPGEPK